MIRKWSRILAVAILPPLLFVVSFAVPVGQREHYVCVDCGTYFQDRVMFGIDMPIRRDKDRTAWYARRVGKEHDHRWIVSGCRAGITIWQQPVSFGCPSVEKLAIHGDWVAGVLSRLEPMDLDLKLHALLTVDDPAARDAAMEGCQYCETGWGDERVRAWWAKTGKFVATPNAWAAGFEKFDPTRSTSGGSRP